MKAVVYHGPGRPTWEDVPDPQVLQDTDVIVGVDAVTICGTDLHILKGDAPEVTAGTILGHEAVGTVEGVGNAVRTFQPGDRVLVSGIAGCGTCPYCREGHYGQCTAGGGWALGHTIDGVQAEYARVPFGDLALHALPPGVTDESAVLIADIGVHGAPATLHLESLWIENVTITTGLVDTSSTPTRLRLLADGDIDPTPLVTHHFALDGFMEAYDVFSRPAETGALKVVLQRG